MINPYKRSSRVKPLLAYLKQSFKFYDLDQPLVAQVIFIILLGVTFGGFVFLTPFIQKLAITYEQLSVRLMEQMKDMEFNAALINPELYADVLNSLFAVLTIVIAIKATSFLVSLFYGFWYYFSLSDPELKGHKRAAIFFRRLPKIIVFNLIFYLVLSVIGMFVLMALGIVSAIIPALSFIITLLPVGLIVLNSLFVFKDLLILEFNIGILRNFKKTLDLTRGSKKNIILNSLFPLFLSWIFSYFVITIQNHLFALLIASFIEVILLMVSQRLVANMFIDATSSEPKN